MMKRSLMLLVLLSLTVVSGTVAATSGKRESYDANRSYDGPYEAARVYRRPPAERSDDREWLERKGFASTREIDCNEARAALRVRGEWTGNLDRQGHCLDPGEPMEWATGNYINYLDGAEN